MINFLPPEATRAVKREYVIRTLSVWALLVALVALVAVVLLIPTYVLILHQLDALAMEVVVAENSASTHGYETARVALENTQTLATQLTVDHTGPTGSEVWRAIQDAQLNSITISAFSYEQTNAKSPQGASLPQMVEVRGVAATREALAAFSAALERNPLFARAAVPVSDLAEDHDLPFTLNILLANTGTKP